LSNKIDILKGAEDVFCKKCDSNVYESLYVLKKLTADVSPSGADAVVPVPIFKCSSCGEINRDYFQLPM
jgi:hypothetical protein